MFHSSRIREIDIESLLHWVYQRQKADRIVDSGAGLHDIEAEAGGRAFGQSYEIQHVSADGVARIAEIQALGATIDNGGHRSGELHPDAEAVHEAVMVRRKGALTPLQRGLILMHARAGTRPDWMPGATERWEPKRRPDGSIKVVWGRDGRKDLPSYCEIILAVSQEEIDLARRVYGEWHAGMAWLRWYLSEHRLLKDHAITGPVAASSPWERCTDSRVAA